MCSYILCELLVLTPSKGAVGVLGDAVTSKGKLQAIFQLLSALSRDMGIIGFLSVPCVRFGAWFGGEFGNHVLCFPIPIPIPSYLPLPRGVWGW